MNVLQLIRSIEEVAPPPRPQQFKSTKTTGFDKCFHGLPPRIQDEAKQMFRKWMDNIASTDFREVGGRPDIWRISITNSGPKYRALAQKLGPGNYRWYWIGSHADYNRRVDK